MPNYSYTGGVQTYSVTQDGIYKLEVWGAKGGNGNGAVGGNGGYSVGYKRLSAGQTIYVVVGGQGTATTGTASGGYNGGGACRAGAGTRGSGGGATHMAFVTGTIKAIGKTTFNQQGLIVAGGGGGGCDESVAGGSGGGTSGGNGQSSGGTQTSGYAFGQGYSDTSAGWTSGGGGGYYGGTDNRGYSAGGGSGWIGGVPSFTYKGSTYSSSTSNGGNAGNGKATITLVKSIYTIQYDANGHGTAPSSQEKIYDESITLSAYIDGGEYRQTSWNTQADGSGTSYSSGETYSANANLSLYAIWTREYTITLSQNLNIQNVSVSGGGTYEENTQISLTATYPSGILFNGWYENDVLVSTDNPYQFILNSNRTIVGNFEYEFTPTLSFDTTRGSATLTRWNTDYNKLTLSCSPNANYYFVGWYVNNSKVSSALTYTYTLTMDRTIEARFITISLSDDEHGSSGFAFDQLNAQATFTCIPDTHYHFLKYTINNVDYTTTPLVYDLFQDVVAVCYYEEDEQYDISVSTDQEYCSVYQSATREYVGENVTLWARPFPNYNFKQWSDNVTTNPRTFVVSDNVTLVAEYVRQTETNGIYQYRCFVKDQLDMTAQPKSFMVVDTFQIRNDLLTKATSNIVVKEIASNINNGDVIVIYNPQGITIYQGVITSISDNTISCSQIQSFFKGTWIYNTSTQASLEQEISTLVSNYAQGKLFGSSYTDTLVAQRLGGFTIQYVASHVGVSLPTDLDEENNPKYTTKDMESWIYELYQNYGIVFDFTINFSGANYLVIKVPTLTALKIGNNVGAIQEMSPVETIEETNKLVIYAKDKTYRKTYIATKNSIVEEPSSTANRFSITNTKVVFSDDALSNLVASYLPSTMYNHKITFTLNIKNFIYKFNAFKLAMPLNIYYGDSYYNSILTGWEISKASNQNVTQVRMICGLVRNKLTQMLTLNKI